MAHDSGDIGRVAPKRRQTWREVALGKQPVRATVSIDVDYPSQGYARLELWTPGVGWTEICARYGEELVWKNPRVSGHGFSARDTDEIVEEMRIEACELLGAHPFPEDAQEDSER